MQQARDVFVENAALILSLGGGLIGCAFGAVVFATNYCAMGALSDIHNFRDYRRFRAWILAAAAALAGTQLLEAFAIVALDKSLYLAPKLNWAGHIIGGGMLGFGMVFAGGCPSRNLARAGGGDLRSLLCLVVLGLVAYMTTGGILAYPRAAIEQLTAVGLAASTQSLGELAARALGLPISAANGAATALIVLAASIYCFSDRRFRSSGVHVFSGLAVGLLVVAGWALTGLAYDDMGGRPQPPISLTYVRPTGDAIEWLTRFTAEPLPAFGTATVAGALCGAFGAAQAMRRFRLTTFADKSDTLRNLMGAVLMGSGGIMAFGCTVGQAISGVSTLALGSFLTFAAIIGGGFWGLRLLERQTLGQ